MSCRRLRSVLNCQPGLVTPAGCVFRQSPISGALSPNQTPPETHSSASVARADAVGSAMPPLEEAIAFLHRRHLTDNQRAMVAAAYREQVDGIARKLMEDGGKKAGRGRPAKGAASAPHPIPKRAELTRSKVGKPFRVGEKAVDAMPTARVPQPLAGVIASDESGRGTRSNSTRSASAAWRRADARAVRPKGRVRAIARRLYRAGPTTRAPRPGTSSGATPSRSTRGSRYGTGWDAGCKRQFRNCEIPKYLAGNGVRVWDGMRREMNDYLIRSYMP